VNVVGKRLEREEDEFLILIASPGIGTELALKLYRRRWEIDNSPCSK
jgi:hypothetical protein